MEDVSSQVSEGVGPERYGFDTEAETDVAAPRAALLAGMEDVVSTEGAVDDLVLTRLLTEAVRL